MSARVRRSALISTYEFRELGVTNRRIGRRHHRSLSRPSDVHDGIGLTVNGASVDDVCRSFSDLKRSHVYECLAYYEDHRAEIDDLVAGQMHDPNA